MLKSVWFKNLKNMNMHHRQGLLIPEQQVRDTNPLFDLAVIQLDLDTPLDTVVLNTTQHTQTYYRVSPDLFLT
jgi:hypothetical protein